MPTTTTTTTVTAGTTTSTTTTTVSSPTAEVRAEVATPSSHYSPTQGKASDVDVLAEQWPREEAGITNEWLSALLGGTVVGRTIDSIGSGVLSDGCIITEIEYTAGTTGRASLMLKYAKGEPGTRALNSGPNGPYEKELLVYGKYADKLGLKLPEVLGTWRDPDAPNEWFCIALENLNEKNRVLDQITGLTYDQNLALAEVIGDFNGRFFEHPILNEAWLAPENPNEVVPFYGVWFKALYNKADFDLSLKAVREKYPVNANAVLANGDPAWAKVIEFMEGPLGMKTMTKYMEVLATRPQTLCHMDVRSDNVFQAKDSDEYTFIDWQTVMTAPIGLEAVELFCASMANGDDFKRINELLQAHYNAAMKAAPAMAAAYPFETYTSDYVLGCVLFFFATCVALKPLFEALPADHPLWVLHIKWSTRYVCHMLKQFDVLGELEKMAATLN